MEESRQWRVRVVFFCATTLLCSILDSFIGPALPDLQCVFNITLQKVTLLPPVIAIGKLIGAILYFLIRGRVNDYAVTSTTTTTACCLLVLFPFITSFWIALVVSGVLGLVLGIAFHATIVLSGELSKQHAAFFHITNIVISTGHFMGPWIISLFLSDDIHYHKTTNLTESTRSENNTTFVSRNGSTWFQDELCHNFNSNVMYGFYAIGSLGVTVLVGYIFSRQVFQDKITKSVYPQNEPQNNNKVNPFNTIDILFFITTSLYIAGCSTMMCVYGQFLQTFGIHCRLYVTARQAKNITLSFYGCKTIGRMLGALSSHVIKQTFLIYVCTVGSILVSITLVYVSEINVIWLWTGTSLLGFICDPVVSAVQTWALDVSDHRTNMCGIFALGNLAGHSVMNLLTGQLMALIFVQMLNCVMVSISVLQLLLIIVLYVTARSVKRKKSDRECYSYIE